MINLDQFSIDGKLIDIGLAMRIDKRKIDIWAIVKE